MIKIDLNYDDYFDSTDPSYPGGKAIDSSTSDAEDGTSWKALLFNDWGGFFQAAIVEANGRFVVSGVPDRVGASDILNAIKKIINNQVDINTTAQFILARLLTVDGEGSGLDADKLGGFPSEYYQKASSAGLFIKQISGEETVIPWTEFDIDYEPEKRFCIFISPHGIYKDYVSFPAEPTEDGLRIIPQRLVNGKLVPGTGRKKWGTGKWGEGKIWVEGRKWGMGTWGSGTWDASRFLGGEAWGEYAPMPINIQIKEA